MGLQLELVMDMPLWHAVGITGPNGSLVSVQFVQCPSKKVVVNPDPEVSSSGRIAGGHLYLSTRCDLQIRIL